MKVALPDLLLVLLSFLSSLAIALPSWDAGILTRPFTSTAVNNLVPGANIIEVVGPLSKERYVPKHLNVRRSAEGVPGEATISDSDGTAPPVFFVNQRQLWQLTNQTSILAVNLQNVTGKAPVPLKLVLEQEQGGVEGGTWRWQGSRLFYDYGKLSNNGLYFACDEGDGSKSVYTSLQGQPAPVGCQYVTLHSFTHPLKRSEL